MNLVVRNSSSNATLDDEINENVLLINKVGTPLYVLLVLLPSLFLNGLIILAFVKKYVRTPLNLLTVNQCCAGIFSNFLNGFILLIATPIALKQGSCDTGPPLLAASIWTHYWQQASGHTTGSKPLDTLRNESTQYCSHFSRYICHP